MKKEYQYWYSKKSMEHYDYLYKEPNDYEKILIKLKKLPNPDNKSLMYIAVKNHLSEAVIMLIKNNPSTLCPDINGESPLHWCVKFNNLVDAKLLLETGNIFYSRSHTTPLYDAVIDEKVDMVSLLLSFYEERHEFNNMKMIKMLLKDKNNSKLNELFRDI